MREVPYLRLTVAYLFSSVLAGAETAPVHQIPSFPIGFEPSGDLYQARHFGSAIQISPGVASVITRSATVRFRAVDANPESSLTAEGDAGTLSEMVGSDRSQWRMDVPLFARVRNAGVYPGIELDWHGQAGRLEYDFQIAPRSDPQQIAIRIEGASGVKQDSAGDLVIATADGRWTQHKPVAYQMINGARREISSRTVLNGNTIRFALGVYDPSLPLTIDPALVYSTYLGGANTDEAHAIGIDGRGDTFVAGLTYSTKIGNSNVFVVAVPPSGVPTVIVIGGTLGNDLANGIAVDAAGDFFVVGSTTSTDFPVIEVGTGINIQTTEFGLQKAIALGFQAGVTTPVWSEYFGGSASDEALGIALGPNDLLYIVGDTDSTDFLNYTSDGALINANDLQDYNGGGYDGYLVSMDTNGAFSFATYMGGPGNDYSNAVAVNSNSQIFVVGSTTSTNFNTTNAFQEGLGGGEDAFATSFSYDTSTGASTFYFITYIGGSSDDVANAVALDTDDNVYIAGTTGSTDFPVSDFAYQTIYQGGTSDGFVFVLSSNPAEGVWSSYLGTGTADVLNAIALDASGDIFVTGSTDSIVFPVTSDAVQSTNGGGLDVIISEFNNAGTSLLFSTYLGGSGDDVGRGIAVDTSGNIYVDGITASSSNDFPVTAATDHQAYGGGSSDAFLSILGCTGAAPAVASGGVTNAASYLATAVAPGGIISIFGTDFACSSAGASTVPLTTSLSGVTVKVNGTAIPLYYAGATQINAQLPYETPAGSATMTVTNAYGTSAAATFNVVETGPGTFVAGTQAAALNYPAYTVNSTSNGAEPGSVVIVYLTGLGPVSPAIADGAAAPASPLSLPTATPVSATINGQAMTIDFLGMAPGYVGLGQANLVIPAGMAAGTYPVLITIGTVTSQAANITVSN
ncbi:SBBP repeat-containing protein [Nevskia soli]|uniref:DUF7948 domain-containing protein n=1 Tax=Nevskia soli TaxID=418856 RepID=UPI0015D87439|nr:SBBP repeat-containing protein [Nevskia soli]